ncbi:Ribonuclease H domain-containing protein [Hirschfeldia incana]|nr:Ribonuclease H domain-containing protein [Hirschfeldia incana]
MWRALAGALAVAERLRYRSINVDVTWAEEIWEKIQLDAEAWRAANVPDKEDVELCSELASLSGWQKPCPSFIKCNIGSSWIDANNNCGVAWLTRDHQGAPLAHSRRSYSGVATSLEAELLGFYWAAESLSTMRYGQVVFESSSYLAGEAILQPDNFPQWSDLLGAIREKLSLLRLWSIAFVPKHANVKEIY